jgi:hypothetical protein
MVAFDNFLYARGRTVEPEVMLRVSEETNVRFETCRSSGHGQGVVGRWGNAGESVGEGCGEWSFYSHLRLGLASEPPFSHHIGT